MLHHTFIGFGCASAVKSAHYVGDKGVACIKEGSQGAIESIA